VGEEALVVCRAGAAVEVEAMPGGAVLGADVVAAMGAGDGSSVREEAGSVPHAARTRLSPSPTGQACDLRSMPKV
jgi:hypothetical protein